MKKRTPEQQREFAKELFIDQIQGMKIKEIIKKHKISSSYFTELKKKYPEIYIECKKDQRLLELYGNEFNAMAEIEPEKAEQIVKSVSTQPRVKVLVHLKGDKDTGFEVEVFEPELDGEAYREEFDRRVKNKIQWTVVLKSNDFI